MKRAFSGLCVVGMFVACSDGDGSSSSLADGGRGGQSGVSGGTSGSTSGGAKAGEPGSDAEDAGAAGSPPNTPSIPSAGATNVGAGGASGKAGEGGTGGDTTASPIPLPSGSREYDGVVNLVDAAAAAELEAYVLNTKQEPYFLRERLTKSMNLFLEHYLEEYDFVFLFTDHVVEGATFAGQFEAINRPAVPGGSAEIEVAVGGYATNGRTKGAIVIPYQTQIFPPYAHEVLHFWANHLDERFGFGVGQGVDYGVHWGFAGVNGQLGGFDPASLRCETPASAKPPNCTALSNGRTRYVVGAFGAFANGFRDVPYSPLELYLMGLIPASQAPETIPVLTDAAIVEDATAVDSPMVLEAAGMTTVALSDIIARHGAVPEVPERARRFASAFVVISAEPAPAEVLERVALQAAVFGDRQMVSYGSSFAKYTGGLATMDTRIGRRRDASTPPAPVRERFECDLIDQDCGDPALACYLFPPTACVLSGGLALDEPCDTAYACAPGLACVSGTSAPDAYVCQPYCDPESTTSAKACANLCPTTFFRVMQNDAVVGAVCTPE